MSNQKKTQNKILTIYTGYTVYENYTRANQQAPKK